MEVVALPHDDVRLRNHQFAASHLTMLNSTFIVTDLQNNDNMRSCHQTVGARHMWVQCAVPCRAQFSRSLPYSLTLNAAIHISAAVAHHLQASAI